MENLVKVALTGGRSEAMRRTARRSFGPLLQAIEDRQQSNSAKGYRENPDVSVILITDREIRRPQEVIHPKSGRRHASRFVRARTAQFHQRCPVIAGDFGVMAWFRQSLEL